MSVPLKEMKSALKKLRAEHSGKAISKMSAEEVAKEIKHHEDACKHREMHEKRMNALKKAREARAGKKHEEKKEEPKKQTAKDKEDEKLGEEVETIKSRMSKKKSAK